MSKYCEGCASLREAILEILDHDHGNKLNYDEITEIGKEAISEFTATRMGFKVGKTYYLSYDDRCKYHVFSETHYAASYKDGREPEVFQIHYMGTKQEHDYQEVEE